MNVEKRKKQGAYYTPDDAVQSLARWAVRRPTDRLLDPSSGDGRFLALHKRCVGVEQDPDAAAHSRVVAPWALVHEGDFFDWAASTRERFECAAGNPPFIRYQRFGGSVRDRALTLCTSLGAQFSGLASSWAPFLVAAASLLKAGGRMAFVVPAEIGHAPYARPLVEYLMAHFSDVRILAVREKIFPELSEDTWLLYADGYMGKTNEIKFVSRSRFSYSVQPPSEGIRVSSIELKGWNYRLRPLLMGRSAGHLYQEIARDSRARRLGQLAQVGIGYVTGANDFFHLKPSFAKKMGIPPAVLQPTVRNGRALAGRAITRNTVKDWLRKDEAFLLLHLSSRADLTIPIKRYLDTAQGQAARASYKCSNRSPWYVVPDVVIPDGFLAYMSSNGPALVANQAACSCTNSVHTVRLAGKVSFETLRKAWMHLYTQLSCEVEGHPLGGGVLKVEPREAQSVVIAPDRRWLKRELDLIQEGMETLKDWRHYSGQKTTASL